MDSPIFWVAVGFALGVVLLRWTLPARWLPLVALALVPAGAWGQFTAVSVTIEAQEGSALAGSSGTDGNGNALVAWVSGHPGALGWDDEYWDGSTWKRQYWQSYKMNLVAYHGYYAGSSWQVSRTDSDVQRPISVVVWADTLGGITCELFINGVSIGKVYQFGVRELPNAWELPADFAYDAEGALSLTMNNGLAADHPSRLVGGDYVKVGRIVIYGLAQIMTVGQGNGDPLTPPGFDDVEPPATQPVKSWVEDMTDAFIGDAVDGQPAGMLKTMVEGESVVDVSQVSWASGFIETWYVPADSELYLRITRMMEALKEGSAVQMSNGGNHSWMHWNDFWGSTYGVGETLRKFIAAWSAFKADYPILIGMVRVFLTGVMLWQCALGLVGGLMWSMGWRSYEGFLKQLSLSSFLSRGAGSVDVVHEPGAGERVLAAQLRAQPWRQSPPPLPGGRRD